MRMTACMLISTVLLMLNAACHGPPIMSRIQPRYGPVPPATTHAGQPVPPGRSRPPPRDVLSAPFLSREGKPSSIVTDKMIADIERAIRLRQEAKRPPADPCSQAIERARRLKYRAGVGQEERGSIQIPCPPELLKQLWNKLAK